MFTRFTRQYLISVYSRAHDLPKVFSEMDPEPHFKLFLKAQIIFKESTTAKLNIC